jgi:SAM-dependent methyltransferase
LEILPNLTDGASLCDVGCADGQFLDLARKAGWHGVGVEMNPPAAARARDRGFDVHEGVLENIDDLPWGTFDAVTCWDVIEHTPHPRTFAERLVRLLVPGGTLLLTTLNREALVARVFGSSWSMVAEDHFTYWTPRALRRLIEANHATVLNQTTSGLGRDLVAWIGRSGPMARGSRDASVRLAQRSWDTSPLVLGAEAGVNRLLTWTGLGVELRLVARAAKPAPCR